MLDFDDVGKRFGGVVALDRCTFQARPGRLTGFLGPNAAGKSTAMRAVFGLVAVDSKFPLENYHRMFDTEANEADRSLADSLNTPYCGANAEFEVLDWLDEPSGIASVTTTRCPCSTSTTSRTSCTATSRTRCAPVIPSPPTSRTRRRSAAPTTTRWSSASTCRPSTTRTRPG